MIVQFNKRSYVDVDSIAVLRKFDQKENKKNDKNYGLVIAAAGCIYLNKEEFKVIEQAYIRFYRDLFYSDDGRKLVVRAERGK